MGYSPPKKDEFTKEEWQLICKLNTPKKIQNYLHQMPYNWEKTGETLQGFRRTFKSNTAHCFEGALFACTVLEQHGYYPRILSLESWEGLDHVLCLYQDKQGRYGTIGKSRLLGMCGRKPRYKTIKALAMSYFETYVHLTGRLIGYSMFDLGAVKGVDWRFSKKNLWTLSKQLCDLPHKTVYSSDKTYARLHWRYLYFKVLNPDKPAIFYKNRRDWL